MKPIMNFSIKKKIYQIVSIILFSFFLFNNSYSNEKLNTLQSLAEQKDWLPLVQNSFSRIHFNKKYMKKENNNIWKVTFLVNVLKPTKYNKGEKSSKYDVRINCDLKKMDLIEVTYYSGVFASKQTLEVDKSPKEEWIDFKPKSMWGTVIQQTCS